MGQLFHHWNRKAVNPLSIFAKPRSKELRPDLYRWLDGVELDQYACVTGYLTAKQRTMPVNKTAVKINIKTW